MSKTVNNSVFVVILTETGDGYTDEGVQVVSDMIQDHGETRDLIFLMGEQFNDKTKFCDLLEKNPDTYVVFSYDGPIQIGYDKQFINDTIKNIKNCINDSKITSWDVVYNELKEANYI